MVAVLIIVFSSLVIILHAHTVRYEDHKVYRIVAKTEKDAKMALKLQHYFLHNGIDIWHETNGQVEAPLDFRLAPDMKEPLEIARIVGLNPRVLIGDLQTSIEQHMTSNLDRRGLEDGTFNYGIYHTLDEISAWMDNMTSFFSSMTELVHIGASFEKRPLLAIKISKGDKPEKPSLFFQGGIHAREWISPATMIYMTNQLLELYGKRDDVTRIIDEFNIYVVPVVNVDGYVYSWQHDRIWRKTRSVHPRSNGCVGVDPNRNWDIHWCDQKGSSKDACSDSYCGPSPFSERVVSGVARFIKGTPGIRGFIDFHSYSQLWMTPWGWSTDTPKDGELQNKSSEAAVRALSALYGTKYKYGTIANTIYIASGSSSDWTYGVGGIKYSAGVELRDAGTYGFLLPSDQIIPTGQETLEGLLAFAEFIINNP